MPLTKRKISVSVDEDLVAELETGKESLSAQVNLALREKLERSRQRRRLGEFLDELDGRLGPADEALVQKYMRLFE